MTDAGEEVPWLVPARMLNEFTYCPRLFHLEWVQGEFTDNDETVHGRSVHRRVDAPAGPLPPSEEMDEPVAARSVLLDAPSLGIIAKIDLIEGTADEVTPVERKRGRPRDDGGVWEPEELQVVAQALVLRENGYRVTHGIVSYPEARARVRLDITDERQARLARRLSDLREVAAGECPPPLIDSPKCPRCSLVGICLPDETNELSGRDRIDEPRPVRRLISPADDASPLYVQEQGARIGRRGNRVRVTRDDQMVADLRSIDVSSVGVFGNVSISAPALRGFCEDGVAVTHHTYGGWLVGVTTGAGHKNAELRIRQFATAGDERRSLDIAREIVVGKIKNSRTLLRRNHRGEADAYLAELASLARRASRVANAQKLLGVEGAAARAYFAAFNGLLREEATVSGFVLQGRTRRPPRDPVNALLGFSYSLLLRETVAAAVRVGLDPFVGVYHRPRYGRPALGLDLAEEFRPLVADSVVVSAINGREVTRRHLVERGGAFALTATGRRALIAAFERRMAQTVRHPTFGYTVSYRRIIELQARIAARVMTGELPRYLAFTTR